MSPQQGCLSLAQTGCRHRGLGADSCMGPSQLEEDLEKKTKTQHCSVSWSLPAQGPGTPRWSWVPTLGVWGGQPAGAHPGVSCPGSGCASSQEKKAQGPQQASCLLKGLTFCKSLLSSGKPHSTEGRAVLEKWIWTWILLLAGCVTLGKFCGLVVLVRTPAGSRDSQIGWFEAKCIKGIFTKVWAQVAVQPWGPGTGGPPDPGKVGLRCKI